MRLLFRPGVSMTAEQAHRWEQLLRGIAEAIAPGPRLVVVDAHHHAAEFADRLAETLAGIGQDCARLSDQNPLLDEDTWRIGPRSPHASTLADWSPVAHPAARTAVGRRDLAADADPRPAP